MKEIFWTEERIELLRKLAGLKLSARLIAAKMGVTKNSVIGKLNRLQIYRREIIETVKRRYNRAIVYKPLVPRAKNVKQPYLPFIPAIDVPVLKVPLLDLESHHCRYPLDERCEDGFALFCGLPIHNTSYCRDHYALCTYRRK